MGMKVFKNTATEAYAPVMMRDQRNVVA